MFQRVILVLAAFALPPLLLAGCGGGASRVSAPPTFGDPEELVAWVTATPVEFHIGQTTQIEVGVRNPTKRPIVMGFTSGSCRLSYIVKNASGTAVAPGFACTADAPTYQMAPGEILTAHFSWDGTSSSGSPLAAGEYQVESSGFLVPSTTPITVHLLAP